MRRTALKRLQKQLTTPNLIEYKTRERQLGPSCLCKIMERMINDRLVWYLKYNGLISNLQCGFRSKRCTTDHLVRLKTVIREGFLRNEHLTAIFFDLEKAYDTTWKYGIMRDMCDLGLKGRLPHFISGFLSDRKFKVHIGSTLSLI